MKRIGAGRRDLIHFLLRLLIGLVGLHVVGRNAVSILFQFAVHHRLLLHQQRGGQGTGPIRESLSLMGLSPRQVAERAGKGHRVIGWKLDPDQRMELLQQFPPIFSEIVADHVTLAAKVRGDAELPEPVTGEIVGRIDDGKGVEAMVVEIEGSPDRPDGSIYHITWSLAPGRRAKESNDVIRQFGWAPIELPMPVELRPERF